MNGASTAPLGRPAGGTDPDTALRSASLDQKLTALKLARIRQVYPSWVEQAAQTQLGYADLLDELVTEELLARQEHQLRRHLRQANFPYAATIEQFDFTLRPELKRTVILRYLDSSFVTSAGSLLLIGASGLGKTHLAIAVGTKMVHLGYRVRFLTAQQLANAVLAAPGRVEVAHLVQPLLTCHLLILDEFGYLPLDPQVGPVLYEVLAGRYEKGATIITSNKSLSSWGQVVGDTALMMALADRLLHHGEVFYLRGSSYRMRGKEPVTFAAGPEGAIPAPPSSLAPQLTAETSPPIRS
jgi:DNA replication protein DnaC